MKKLDKSILTTIRHFLKGHFEEVYHETTERSIDYFVKRKGSQGHDHLAVFLDCDNNLQISADCWEQENNVLLENAIQWLLGQKPQA